MESNWKLSKLNMKVPYIIDYPYHGPKHDFAFKNPNR